MSRPAWVMHDRPEAMANEVCRRIEFVARKAVAERGRALLAFPGGRSPIPIFERLRECSLPWEHVTILPTDDRLVAGTHPLSNAGLLARYFQDRGARLLSLISRTGKDYRRAGRSADAALRSLPWPPDLIWLGVGLDGHTASIFPGPDLLDALNRRCTRRVLGVLPDPLPEEAPVARVTLTCAAIRSARRTLLALTGEGKRAVVERATRYRTGSTIPITRVLARPRSSVEIHWSPA